MSQRNDSFETGVVSDRSKDTRLIHGPGPKPRLGHHWWAHHDAGRGRDPRGIGQLTAANGAIEPLWFVMARG